MNKLFYKYIVMPFFFRLKNLKRFRYYKEIKERDYLTVEELKKIQWRKLKLLVDHCYYKIPYYKKLFDKNMIHPDKIRTLEDFAQIPVLTKHDIKEHFNDLINPYLKQKDIFYDSTSGSTGIPLQLARSWDDQEYGAALKYRSNSWCGWNYWNKSVWLVSDTRRIKELDSLKGRIILAIQRKLVINTKNITKENMFDWVNQIKKYKPDFLYGYSSIINEFARFIMENNITVSGVNGVISTAETLRNRDLISQAFNAPVYDQYGSSEIFCTAHECIKGNMHFNIDEILVEFADISDSSEIKKMICTPLYLYGMPLLRYDIQDSAIPVVSKCDCGLPYPIIDLKVGRLSDNLISDKGKLVSGVTLSWYLTDATHKIEQYQIIQEKFNDFVVKMVCPPEYRDNNENEIRILLSEMLEMNNFNIKFEYLNQIPPGKNGKYRPIFSKMIDNYKKVQPISN
jgi:phenylacetate-CoA ligase